MSPRNPQQSTFPGDAAPTHADRFLVAVAVDGEVLFAGPSVPAVLGFDRTEFVGSDLLEVVHPAEQEPVSDAISAVATRRRVTHRLRRENGGYTWVESIVDDEVAPEFGGRVLTARRVDIDRTFPEQFREFLEYGTDIVTVVDADGRVRYESPSVEEVLGYEQGSLVGRSPLGYVHPDDRKRVTEAFYRALDDPDVTNSLEFRYRTADGDWIWLESRTRALPEDAVAGRLVINSRDVTERKRRERRLADRNERLDRFASIVSHDLRNPLSVVQASMEMAELKGDTEPLARGQRAADRIDQLITELLTLARQGDGIDDLTEFTLSSVAQEAWDTAGEDDAELIVRDDARVYADRSRLRQAFENLFRNSVEHGSTSSRAEPGDSVEHGSTSSRPRADNSVEHGSTSSRAEPGDSVEHGSTSSRPPADDSVEHDSTDEPDGREGSPTVTVIVTATDRGMVVADDGPGIDPEYEESVFDPGFTTAENGTGYGLDIVREVIDAHGWSVAVASERPDGSAALEASGARFEIEAPNSVDVEDEPWLDPARSR